MIYFDKNKEAYNNRETLERWGKNCIYSCEDDKYKEFLLGKYIWNENDEMVLNPEWDNIVLDRIRQEKILKNDKLRDEALIKGVIYKGVLFDSDTDQKINLLAMINNLETGEFNNTVIWYGKDNTPLECTKEDLINIGNLISELHTFIWAKNAQIKQVLNNALSENEINATVIDYGRI